MACLASLVASTLLALHGALHSPALLLMVVRRLRSADGGGSRRAWRICVARRALPPSRSQRQVASAPDTQRRPPLTDPAALVGAAPPLRPRRQRPLSSAYLRRSPSAPARPLAAARRLRSARGGGGRRTRRPCSTYLPLSDAAMAMPAAAAKRRLACGGGGRQTQCLCSTYLPLGGQASPRQRRHRGG